MIECKYEVKPFPYEWCTGCVFNGCYPWNRNPLLLCSRLGGNLMQMTEEENGTLKSCLTYELVTFDVWNKHFEDLQKEAKDTEAMRLKAMQGQVRTNQQLPV